MNFYDDVDLQQKGTVESKNCWHKFLHEKCSEVHRSLVDKKLYIVVNNDMAVESQGEKSPSRLVMDKNPMDWNLFRPRLEHSRLVVSLSLKA